MSPASVIGIGVVRAYQWTVRPLLGANCRFMPSCSDYAVEALRCHGACRGGLMAGKRILRCNPWHPGGYDPVPPARLTAAPMPPAGGPSSDDRTGS